MIIQLNFEAEKPIYLQLVHQIIEGVASGKLEPGETLPSVRVLAADIGINLHTVNKAYQQLKQDGFILVHRRKGVMVNPEGTEKTDGSHQRKLEEALRPFIAEAICRGMDAEAFKELSQNIFSDIKEGKQ